MQATRLLQNNNPPQNQSQTSQVQYLQVLKSNKGTQLLLINKFHSHLQEIKNTSNMYLNHLITPCKPPACSNTTTHHKSNFQHHKYIQSFISFYLEYTYFAQAKFTTFRKNSKLTCVLRLVPHNFFKNKRERELEIKER